MRVLVCIICILFSFVSYSQDSLKVADKQFSFVKNEKISNVVYRGVQNPISIYVPEAKSFIATGLGLQKRNDNHFFLSPGPGLQAEIKLEITLQNDSIIYESQHFKIKQINSLIGLINGVNCFDCIIKLTKDEFLNGIISYKIPDFEFDINFYKVISFDIFIKNKKISVRGNKIPNDLKIRKESTVKIENIDIENPFNICFMEIYPIDIVIVE